MFNQFVQVRGFFQQAEPLLQKYLDQGMVSALQAEIAQRTADSQPVVMVYGVYNAGKSTLINALLGQELAEVGDTPMTYQVSKYQIGDVCLLDTPGIDAPVEHEAISREQLAKADAVVFVLSSGGVFEEEQTFREIGNILQDNKPLLVVINNKDGFKPDSSSYAALMTKFRTNLNHYFADQPQLLERVALVDDYLVDAKLALKGRLQDKPQLVAHSQIQTLEASLSRLFARASGAQIAKTLAAQLQNLLRQAQHKAQQGSQADELHELQELIKAVTQAMTTIKDRTLSQAASGKPALKAELTELLQSNQSQGAEAVVQRWQENIGQVFERLLTTELERLQIQSSVVVDLFSQRPEYLKTDDGQPDLNASDFDLAGMMQDLLKQTGLGADKVQQLTQEGIVAALKYGKQLFPELFKGVGKVTMGRWATAATAGLGVVVSIGMAIWDYNKAAEHQQRQIDQQTAQLQRMQLKVESYVDGIYDNLETFIDELLNNIFASYLAQLQSALKRLSHKNQGVESEATELELLAACVATLIDAHP